MNSYLHNLTMRTLNLGNRVEPLLPSLFEARHLNPGPTPHEEIAENEPYQEKISNEPETTSSEKLPQKADSFANNPPATKPIPEDRAVVSDRQSFNSEAASYESNYRKDEDPVEASHIRTNLSPSKEHVKNLPQFETKDSEEERILENSRSSLEPGELPSFGSLQDLTETKAVTGHRTPGRDLESSPTVLIPRLSPEDQFQEQLSFEKTARSVATNRIESRDGAEKTVRRDLEESEDSLATKSRLNPTHTWRNAREQPTPWRRRQSFGPIESEPSINVTIGRVEVRAVPADNRKTTSQPRSESPVMPLEDYLRKQRRGGER